MRPFLKPFCVLLYTIAICSTATKFEMYDLVLINEQMNDTIYDNVIALYITGNDEKCIVTCLIIDVEYFKKRSCTHYYHQCRDVSTKVLHHFKAKRLKSRNLNHALTDLDRLNLQRMHDSHLSFMDYNYSKRHTYDSHPLWSIIKSIPKQAMKNLFFASTVFHVGIHGLFYLNNLYFDNDSKQCFKQFYAKYLRLEPRLTACQISILRSDDLFKIKALKQQSNKDLQYLALHFDDSFGEITSFKCGDLIRKNSRNQTEFAIQSLSNHRLRLALRPKYLMRISKIYIHRIWDDSPVLHRSYWEDSDNELLYLPYFYVNTTQMFTSNEFQCLMYAMHNQGHENIILDPAISACSILIDMTEKCSSYISNVFVSLPLNMDRVTWARIMKIIERLRKAAKSKERQFFEGIEKLFKSHQERIMNAITKVPSCMMQFGEGPSGITHSFYKELKRKMEKDLRKAHGKKNLLLYTKLLEEIAKETKRWLHELHPDYWREFDQHFACMIRKYAVSVIHHYLKANVKGHDLHVVYFGQNEMFDDLHEELAAKINAEWGVNDLNMSAMLAERIII